MRYFALVLYFLLISCNDTLTTSTSYYKIEHDKGEVWVCYNKKSHLHDKACSEECLEPGNQSAFCWLLDIERCKEADFHHAHHCPEEER